MNIFGVGPWELLVVALLALIFIGPERLPEIMRQIGRTAGELRRMSNAMMAEFKQELGPIEELQKGISLAPIEDKKPAPTAKASPPATGPTPSIAPPATTPATTPAMTKLEGTEPRASLPAVAQPPQADATSAATGSLPSIATPRETEALLDNDQGDAPTITETSSTDADAPTTEGSPSPETSPTDLGPAGDVAPEDDRTGTAEAAQEAHVAPLARQQDDHAAAASDEGTTTDEGATAATRAEPAEPAPADDDERAAASPAVAAASVSEADPEAATTKAAAPGANDAPAVSPLAGAE